MSRLFLTIALAAWANDAAPPAFAGPRSVPDPPTPDAVREGLATRNVLFQNMSFRFVFQGRDHTSRGGPWRERLQAIDGVCDVNRCVRADMFELPTRPAQVAAGRGKQLHSLTTFTPESIQNSGMSTTDIPMGFIGRKYQVSWLNHPLNLVGLAHFSPIQYLGDHGRASIEVMETIRGEEVVRVGVRWTLAEYPGKLFGLIYWFNPAHGYALVRSEQEHRPAEGMASKITERIDRMDFSRQGPLWLPSKV